MVEISIYSNYTCIFSNTNRKDKKKNKSKKLNSFVAPAVITSTVITNQYNFASIEAIDDMKDNLKAIAEFCRTVSQFIKNVCWCLANPFHALVIFLDYISPYMIGFACIIPIIGLSCHLLGTHKFLKWKPSELVINPLVVYLIYLTFTTVLKSILFLK